MNSLSSSCQKRSLLAYPDGNHPPNELDFNLTVAHAIMIYKQKNEKIIIKILKKFTQKKYIIFKKKIAIILSVFHLKAYSLCRVELEYFYKR